MLPVVYPPVINLLSLLYQEQGIAPTWGRPPTCPELHCYCLLLLTQSKLVVNHEGEVRTTADSNDDSQYAICLQLGRSVG